MGLLVVLLVLGQEQPVVVFPIATSPALEPASALADGGRPQSNPSAVWDPVTEKFHVFFEHLDTELPARTWSLRDFEVALDGGLSERTIRSGLDAGPAPQAFAWEHSGITLTWSEGTKLWLGTLDGGVPLTAGATRVVANAGSWWVWPADAGEFARTRCGIDWDGTLWLPTQASDGGLSLVSLDGGRLALKTERLGAGSSWCASRRVDRNRLTLVGVLAGGTISVMSIDLGTPERRATMFSSISGESGSNPVAAEIPNGVVVAWDGNEGFKSAYVPLDGGVPTLFAPSVTSLTARRPTLAAAPDGTAILSWEEADARTAGGTVEGPFIRARLISVAQPQPPATDSPPKPLPLVLVPTSCRSVASTSPGLVSLLLMLAWRRRKRAPHSPPG